MNSPASPWLASGRIPSLDGLRAFAVLLVTASHLIPTAGSPFGPSWHGIKHFGATGVNVFFVISGFLITHLLFRERERTGRISLGGFWTRRALRIIPAYLFVIGFVFGLVQLGLFVVDPRSWIPALTYTYNLVPGIDPTGLGHLWSLAVEEHFYLLWPLALVALGRRSAPIALVLALIVPAILRFALRGWSGPDIDYFTPTRIDVLAVGCLLAFFAHSPRSEAVARFARGKGSLIALLSLGVVIVSVTVLSKSGKYVLGPKPFVESVATAAAIFALVSDPRCLLGRLLNSRPAVAIGVLSYSLYLAQPFASASGTPGWPLSWWWNLPLVAAYALLSYVVIERPFLRLKDRKGSGPKNLLLASTLPDSKGRANEVLTCAPNSPETARSR